MEDLRVNEIVNYLESESRNKIVIYQQGELPHVTTLDLGRRFAEILQGVRVKRHFGLEAKSRLDQLLEQSVVQHEVFGRILSLKNIGILFEPELKIDFIALLDKYSKTACLFINWEGEIINDTLYFLTKEKGIKIDLKNLSHIIL